ncbi:hypothetical protein GCM10007242_25790 [Pigmentiphaga litoralis]|nr:hypothetical protein GCM10007242_25790 [Pigmentiphaga litoralis]
MDRVTHRLCRFRIRTLAADDALIHGNIADLFNVYEFNHPHADHHPRDPDLRHLALVAFVSRVVVILPGRSFSD